MFGKDHQYFIDLASSRLKISNNIKSNVKSLDIEIFAEAECSKNNLLQGKNIIYPGITKKLQNKYSICYLFIKEKNYL